MAYRKTAYTRKKTEASRHNLLVAALKLFMTRGYHATSMQLVVKQAGTSIGNAYFYFKNKEDLLQAVVQRGMSARFSAVDAMIEPFPAGAERLAVNAYCAVLPPFSGGIVARESIKSGTDSAFLDAFMKAGMERDRELISANLPALSEAEINFAVHAWCGAASHLLRARVWGELQGSAEELARRASSWQLRTLGLDAAGIESGMAAIEQVRESGHWTAFIDTIPRSPEDLDRIMVGNHAS